MFTRVECLMADLNGSLILKLRHMTSPDVGGGVLQRPCDTSTGVEATSYRCMTKEEDMEEPPLLSVFQHIYQLKVCNQGLLVEMVVKKKFRGDFEFLIKWALPSKVICLQHQPLNSVLAIDQYKRLHRGRVLRLENLLTVRNIFCYCLYEQSPNGYQAITNGVESDSVLPIELVWSHEAPDDLGELRHIMDIDSLMLDFQGNKDIGTPEQGVGGSGCKRQQMKEKFVNTKHSSSTNRIHHRKGKEIIVYGGDILVSSTPTALMTLMASLGRDGRNTFPSIA
ncbi:hypothetical protein GOBAR_AA04695 [Gossypium barbadense]|uniref:Uncharacterized protein n=1 Tax=Gossypium barbadense TaxID=3634 RepID=A0A2P5YJV2_GOSBA|nr:hypothetical protein GOBAR_AA04695 [Gossypium barbadense]